MTGAREARREVLVDPETLACRVAEWLLELATSAGAQSAGSTQIGHAKSDAVLPLLAPARTSKRSQPSVFATHVISGNAGAFRSARIRATTG